MRKTLLTYIFILCIIAFLVVCLKLLGVQSRQLSQYLFPVGILFSILVLIFNFNSFLYFLLSTIPFATSIFEHEIGIVTFNLYTLSIIFLTLLIIFKIVTKMIDYQSNPIDIPMATVLFLFLFTTLFSKSIIHSGLLFFHGVFIPIISYFVITNSLKTRADYLNAFNFFMLGLVILGILSLLEYTLTHTRIVILSMPSISIATFLIVPTLYAAYSPSIPKQIKIPTFLICSFALILTYSRVYLLYLCLSPLFYLIIRKRKGGVLLASTLIITLIMTVTISFSIGKYPNKILNNTYQEKEGLKKIQKSIHRLLSLELLKSSLVARAISYREGLLRFMNRPIIGNGLNLEKGTVSTRHNFHTEWLEYGGIIGYLAFTSLFLIYFIKLNRFAAIKSDVAINLLTIFGIILNGLTNGLLHGAMPLVLFIMMGFGMVCFQLEKYDNTIKKVINT